MPGPGEEELGVVVQQVNEFCYAQEESSRDLLHNRVPTVSNTTVCTPKLVKGINLTKCYFHDKRGRLGTLGGVGYVYSLDHSDSITGIHQCPNINLYTLNMCSSLCINEISIKVFFTKIMRKAKVPTLSYLTYIHPDNSQVKEMRGIKFRNREVKFSLVCN